MSGTATAERFSLAELTRAVFGEELRLDEVEARVDAVELTLATDALELRPDLDGLPTEDTVWVASVGYELHKDHRAFAEYLRGLGVERLIDVRDLPISRRRGYAKTALSEALAEAGLEYIHAKALGNPKPLRDLYKSGRVEEGRVLYRRHLLDEHLHDLRELVDQLREKPTVLMCVEHDAETCHRSVIVQALADELDVALDVVELD